MQNDSSRESLNLGEIPVPSHQSTLMGARGDENVEAYWETLMASAPVGMAFVDAQLRFVRVNQALATFNGCSVEEHIGHTPGQIDPALQVVEPRLRRIIETGEAIFGLEVSGPWHGQPGRMRHYVANYNPVRDAQGKVIGVSALVTDITARKDAERARENSEERYRAFVQNSSEAIWRFELEVPFAIARSEDEMIEHAYQHGYLAEGNDALAQMYGFERAEEIVGARLGELLVQSEPENIEYLKAFCRSGFRLTQADSLEFDRNGRAKYFVNNLIGVVENGMLWRAWGTQQDVTERRQAEAELRESELRFRQLAENIDEAFYIWDLQPPRLLYLSPSFDTIWGRSAAEIAPLAHDAQIFLEWVHVDDHDAVRELYRKRALGESSVLEYRIMRPNGELRWVLDRAFPVLDENGVAYRLTGIVQDITERKQTEAALEAGRAQTQASEEKYRFLAESIPQLVWTMGPEGNPIYFNRHWQEYTGTTIEDVQQVGWVHLVHPDDRETTTQAWAHSLRTGEPYQIEYRLKRVTDGAYRWHLGRAVALRNAQGEIMKWFGTCTDIDDQKQAQDALRFLADASEVLSSSLDYEHTLESLAHLVVPNLGDWCSIVFKNNDNSLETIVIAHVDPQKIEWARQMQQRFPPVYDDAPQGIAQVLRSGQAELYPLITEDVLRQHARGPEHFELLSKTGMSSVMIVPLEARGEVFGAISIVAAESKRHYDADDLALAEELARRAAQAVDNARLYRRSQNALQAAEEASRAKDDFLATVSHELRTPLTAILGWANLLRHSEVNPETLSRALDTIERNVKLQAQIVEDLLDVSRIVAGKMRLDLQPLALGSIVQAATEIIAPALHAKSMELHLELDSQVRVAGDVTRLQQVVWNILSNAVKFSPRGGRLEVFCRRVDKHAQIVVKDEGPGIEPAFFPYVFERFRQADSTSTRKHGGLGLGLAIVRHLVEMHGGTVRAEPPVPGEGATFVVELPVWEASSDDANTSQSTLSSSEGNTSALTANQVLSQPETGTSTQPAVPVSGASDHELLEAVRVLVVEDEPDTREIIAAILKRFGAQVETAPNAHEGWGQFQMARPHVLVLDIAMPEVDGYQFLREVRAWDQTQNVYTPAIALTAFAQQSDLQQSEAAGFDSHLAKPVQAVELAHTVAVLSQRQVVATLNVGQE
jgi:PAS domain S-box-containing protein